MIKKINDTINPAAFSAKLTGAGKVYNRNYFYDGVLLSECGYISDYENNYIFCTVFAENIFYVCLPVAKIPKLGKDIAYKLFQYWNANK